MADELLKDYMQIFTHVLRPGKTIPFSCYVHLRAQKRVMPYVGRDHVFTEDKAKKLNALGYYNVYIKTADRTRYFHYLNDYLMTEEGKTALKEYLLENSDLSQVPGLPEDGEFHLSALDETAGEQESVEVKDPAEEDLGSISVEDEDEAQGEVVRFLKNQVEEINGRLKVAGVFEDEEKSVIRNVTEKISDELIRLKALKNCSSREDGDIIIGEVTERIDDEIIRIKSLPKEKQEHLKDYLRELENGVGFIDALRAEPDFPSVDEDTLGEVLAPMKTAVKGLASFGASDLTGLVSESMSKMANEMNERFGIQIHTGFGDVVDGASSGNLNDRDFETLKLLVGHMTKTVFKLKTQNAKTKKDFRTFRDKWFMLTVQVKRYLDVKDAMAVKDLEKIFKAFERELLGTIEHSGALWPSNQKICHVLRMETEELLREDESESLTESDELSELEQFDASDQLVDEEEEASQSEVERLRSENEILRLQMENAQGLVQSSTQKASELEELYQKKDDYIQSLEGDIANFRKRVEVQTERLSDFDGNEEKFEKLLEQSDTTAYRSQEDFKAAQEKIKDANQTIGLLEQELELYRNRVKEIAGGKFDPAKLNETLSDVDPDELGLSEDHAALLSAKDQVIVNQGQDILHIRENHMKDRKALLEAESELTSAEADKKRLAKRLEILKGDFDALKKNCRNLEIKSDSNANLLKHSQKTVNNMTNMVETLKADRQKYIRETNSALHNFKEMMSKAQSLDRQVDAMDRQLHVAEKASSGLKSENTELKANYGREKNRADALEKELRSAKLKLERAETVIKTKLGKAS